MFDVFLLFHVRLIFIEAQHAFHQQSHCVNSEHNECCTSVPEGFHCVNTGSDFQSEELLGRRFYLYETVKGPRQGLKELYILCI